MSKPSKRTPEFQRKADAMSKPTVPPVTDEGARPKWDAEKWCAELAKLGPIEEEDDDETKS